tara:strand:- start:364 stop:600 length:237 start_codon:yes stop_codon:yes gene_type:complete
MVCIFIFLFGFLKLGPKPRLIKMLREKFYGFLWAMIPTLGDYLNRHQLEHEQLFSTLERIGKPSSDRLDIQSDELLRC